MLSVGSVNINCECRSCGHEDMAWRPSDNIYKRSECPKCGKVTFSKKMASFSKDVEIVYINKTKK